jgi:L-malate glycosyltransferase
MSQRRPPWRVAHVIGTLQVGGAERQLVNYLLAADRQRFTHRVVCLDGSGPLAADLARAGIPVHEHRVRLRALPLDLLRLASWLRRERVDIVHSHMFGASLFGRIASLLGGVPVRVVTEHGKELWKDRWQVGMDRLLSHITCRHIAVSEDGRRIRMKRERVPAERIALIPNGVKVPPIAAGGVDAEARASLGLTAGDFVVGSVGRLVQAKGYPHLLRTVAALRGSVPALRGVLIGDGPDREALVELAASLGLGDRFLFAGMRSDAVRCLGALDVFTLPSIREGLPVALLEAMAAARPIVITNVGGMPDAVEDGRSGLVVPSGDEAALGAALKRLADDRALAARLGAAAHARARETYAIEAVAARIEELYLLCLASRVRAGAEEGAA